MDLDGRRVARVIGDDWVINEGGEATIVVNDVKPHDGATGSTGLKAANGAWDVMVIDAGVTVDNQHASMEHLREVDRGGLTGTSHPMTS